MRDRGIFAAGHLPARLRRQPQRGPRSLRRHQRTGGRRGDERCGRRGRGSHNLHSDAGTHAGLLEGGPRPRTLRHSRPCARAHARRSVEPDLLCSAAARPQWGGAPDRHSWLRHAGQRAHVLHPARDSVRCRRPRALDAIRQSGRGYRDHVGGRHEALRDRGVRPCRRRFGSTLQHARACCGWPRGGRGRRSGRAPQGAS